MIEDNTFVEFPTQEDLEEIEITSTDEEIEIIEITPTDDILINIHQEINNQTEILKSIHQQQTDFMMFLYFGFVVIVIIGFSKFLDKVLFRFI